MVTGGEVVGAIVVAAAVAGAASSGADSTGNVGNVSSASRESLHAPATVETSAIAAKVRRGLMRSIVTRPASPTAALVAIDARQAPAAAPDASSSSIRAGVIPHSVSTSRVC